MATASIRSTVKTYIADQLEGLIGRPDVGVSRSWPGPNLQRDHVWVDRVTGVVSYPLMSAGRKYRQDDFTVFVLFQASAPGASGAEVDERVESYCAVFDSMIADDPSLGEMDGVIHALLGDIEGPDAAPISEGFASFMVAQVNVLSRLA